MCSSFTDVDQIVFVQPLTVGSGHFIVLYADEFLEVLSLTYCDVITTNKQLASSKLLHSKGLLQNVFVRNKMRVFLLHFCSRNMFAEAPHC